MKHYLHPVHGFQGVIPSNRPERLAVPSFGNNLSGTMMTSPRIGEPRAFSPPPFSGSFLSQLPPFQRKGAGLGAKLLKAYHKLAAGGVGAYGRMAQTLPPGTPVTICAILPSGMVSVDLRDGRFVEMGPDHVAPVSGAWSGDFTSEVREQAQRMLSDAGFSFRDI